MWEVLVIKAFWKIVLKIWQEELDDKIVGKIWMTNLGNNFNVIFF